MANPIELAAFGWERKDWLAEYYPEDLPEDWHLDYYANEYRHVLVPATFWEGNPDVADWSDLVEQGLGFDFYLSDDLTDKALDKAHAVAELLGDGLQRLVLDTGVDSCRNFFERLGGLETDREVVVMSPCAGFRQCWQPGLTEGSFGPGMIRLDEEPEPRELRHYIERYISLTESDRPILYVDAPPGVMKIMRTLLDLMGL